MLGLEHELTYGGISGVSQSHALEVFVVFFVFFVVVVVFCSPSTCMRMLGKNNNKKHH